MKRIAFFAAALASTLTACQSMDMEGGGTRVLSNNHFISVTVGPGAGGALEIKVDNKEMDIHGPDQVIFWTMDNAMGQSYTFPDKGIAFKTDDGKKEFDCARQTAVKFKCKDLFTKRNTKFEYGITLDGSPRVPPRDPWVVNN
jgi:hypothetical protein